MRGRADEVERELIRRGADRIEHARSSLARHLLGVRAILRRWGEPERVQLVGMLHSAYSTEAFSRRLFGIGDRARVRDLVGVAVERLVFAFCACRRRDLVAAIDGPGDANEIEVATRWSDARVRLSRRDLAELMVVHAANVAEQTCRPNGAPSRWLALAARLLGRARRLLDASPSVFEGATCSFDAKEERALLADYRRMLRAPADARTIEPRLVDSPIAEPLVIAALHARAAGRSDAATALSARALRSLDAWGNAWDKRLRVDRWRQLAAYASKPIEEGEAATLGDLLSACRSPSRMWARLNVLGLLPATKPPRIARARREVDETMPALPPRFARYIAGLATNAERPLMQFYPGLRVQPWFDPAEFPIAADLERAAPEIAREALAFDPARFQDEAENIGRKGKWGVLFLVEMGRRNEANLARCPTLRSILDRHRTLTTHAGLMYFSLLEPRTRVALHMGPTNLRVRCHLGIRIPERCGIRVGGVVGGWTEGRCVVIDDSFPHEVWNDSDERRLILVVDLWHPDLEPAEVDLIAGLHRYGAANEESMHKYWARNEAARRRAERDAPRAHDASDLDRLGESIGAAMRAGELRRASERAAEYASRSRATRWYPVVRDSDPPLPSDAAWSPVLTPAKLLHDIEQLEYLWRERIVGLELAGVVKDYEHLLDTLRPLGADARVPLVGAARAKVGHVYNRLVHVRPTPRVRRALSRDWDPAAAERAYFAEEPRVAVIDSFLAPEALHSLRLFCLQSTIWSTHRYDHGRLGSFFRDGFNCPLLIQIAEELRAALPRVIGSHPVTQIWGFKYASQQPALPPHADFAAVNVNFWITPDEANLEAGAGGLEIYDVKAPKDWDFATYNRGGSKIRALLAAQRSEPMRVAYKCNRVVVFDSDLFHATPALRFASDYESRRINVTFLFGDRTSES